MAKWDLSKLPEGRKPLPDEWFAERAQMQERIEDLEAQVEAANAVIAAKRAEVLALRDKLAEYKHVASAIDTQWAESQDEIADLKAKLEYAVGELQTMLTIPNSQAAQGILKTFAGALISELTGGKDE